MGCLHMGRPKLFLKSSQILHIRVLVGKVMQEKQLPSNNAWTTKEGIYSNAALVF
jgi:hypothetical protein